MIKWMVKQVTAPDLYKTGIDRKKNSVAFSPQAKALIEGKNFET
jgi:hypothetical protein